MYSQYLQPLHATTLTLHGDREAPKLPELSAVDLLLPPASLPPLCPPQPAAATSIDLPPSLLYLDQYTVDLSSYPLDPHQFVCINRVTNEKLTARVYDRETFHKKAQLLLFDVEGVAKPRDFKVWDDKMLVVSSHQYGDLHQFLRGKKRLTEAQAAPLFQQIVSLVTSAHSVGLALRDLKLKKFVFDSKERNHLALNNLEDAHLLSAGGRLSDRHGCPAYICPEMLHHGDYCGRAADLWSLGVILYTLLVGHYPFFDSNPQNLFSKIRSGYYSVPDYVSYSARSIISSLLAYDPESRVNAEDILQHHWFHYAPKLQVSSPAAVLSDQTVPKM